MNDPWFLWALTGIVCIGLEMLLPGFVIFFFGLGGLATALFSLIPFVRDSFVLQIFIFIVFSLSSLFLLRSRFARIFGGTIFDARKADPEEAGIGKIAEVIETAGVVTEGRIRFQGTSWKAFTREGEIRPGHLARIISREGMTYYIEPVAESAGTEGGS